MEIELHGLSHNDMMLNVWAKLWKGGNCDEEDVAKREIVTLLLRLWAAEGGEASSQLLAAGWGGARFSSISDEWDIYFAENFCFVQKGTKEENQEVKICEG